MGRKGQRRGCKIRDFGIIPSPVVRKQEFWGWGWGWGWRMGESNKAEERCEEQRGNKAGFKIGKSIY